MICILPSTTCEADFRTLCVLSCISDDTGRVETIKLCLPSRLRNTEWEGLVGGDERKLKLTQATTEVSFFGLKPEKPDPT